MKVVSFTIFNGYLYNIVPNNVLQICVLEHERQDIIKEAHVGPMDGHFYDDTIAREILQVQLWWPL